MDRWESHSGDYNYEFKMKQMLGDLKGKPGRNLVLIELEGIGF